MISIRAIIESGSRKIHKIYYDNKRAIKHKKELAWLGHRAEESGFEIELCDGEESEKLSSGSTHGGVIAVGGERMIKTPTLEDIPEAGFFMMLEGVEDPFNFGFAVRSAYAAGADADKCYVFNSTIFLYNLMSHSSENSADVCCI